MATKMIIDISNLLFRVASMNNKQSFGSDEEKAGLALHTAFQSVNKYYNKFKPDELAFAFESRSNWRKSYTTSDEAVSKRAYKGNRIKDASMNTFFELINVFKEVMVEHTSVICLSVDGCEADDVIAGYTELYSNGSDEIIIISGDRDFIQLLKFPNVRVIDPATGKDRNKKGDKDYYADIDYFLFEKCIRGDPGDNVMSAYPRVRSTKIKQAYDDEYFRVQLFNEEWTDGEKTYKVGDLYKENVKLMDLTAQPEDVRVNMFIEIEKEVNNPGKFSNFHFLKFLGKYKLNFISEHLATYSNMLCINQTKNLTKSNKITEKEVIIENNLNKNNNLFTF